MIDLKRFRKQNNLTQSELAEYFGVQQPFISQIEQGKCRVPDSFISKIKVDGKYTIEYEEDSKTYLSLENIMDIITQSQEITGAAQQQLTKSQEQLSESQQQINRLITIIENQSK